MTENVLLLSKPKPWGKSEECASNPFHIGLLSQGQVAPGAWVKQAICAQVDPDLWYPDVGNHRLYQQAVKMCSECPVKRQCLQFALEAEEVLVGERHGIWGGVAPRVRVQMAKELQVRYLPGAMSRNSKAS